MTLQEMFDKVAAHLLKQNRKAISADGRSCMYRAPNGDQCAAGCLIPDDKYSPEMEGKTVFSDRVRNAIGEIALNSSGFHLLTDLQGIHDHCDPQSWPDRLEAAAHRFALNPAVLYQPRAS